MVKAAIVFFLLLAPAIGAQQPARPNIVLIITDDLGYGDLGSYGATDIRTPHIDQLARDGARLTQFYANAPTCTPTRAGLITGRWQQPPIPLTQLGRKPEPRRKFRLIKRVRAVDGNRLGT